MASPALTPGHAYTWWIGAVSSNGQATTWSSGQTFTLAALAAPVLTAGPSGMVSMSMGTAVPTFTWTSVEGADHYYVWLLDKTTGALVTNKGVSVTTWTWSSALTVGHSYVFYVAAVSTNGQGVTWDAAQLFTVTV